MSPTRVPLVVGAIIAGFLLVQTLVSIALNIVYLLLPSSNLADPKELFSAFSAASLVAPIVQSLAVGVGVWVSLRWIAPVRETDGWRTAITRGVIATAFAAAADLVIHVIEALLSAATLGSFPFGYSFTPTFNADEVSQQIPAALFSGFYGFIDLLAIVVLAAVLLKVWLTLHVAKVTAPASLAEKP